MGKGRGTGLEVTWTTGVIRGYSGQGDAFKIVLCCSAEGQEESATQKHTLAALLELGEELVTESLIHGVVLPYAEPEGPQEAERRGKRQRLKEKFLRRHKKDDVAAGATGGTGPVKGEGGGGEGGGARREEETRVWMFLDHCFGEAAVLRYSAFRKFFSLDAIEEKLAESIRKEEGERQQRKEQDVEEAVAIAQLKPLPPPLYLPLDVFLHPWFLLAQCLALACLYVVFSSLAL